jgi:hypothetical protein
MGGDDGKEFGRVGRSANGQLEVARPFKRHDLGEAGAWRLARRARCCSARRARRDSGLQTLARRPRPLRSGIGAPHTLQAAMTLISLGPAGTLAEGLTSTARVGGSAPSW